MSACRKAVLLLLVPVSAQGAGVGQLPTIPTMNIGKDVHGKDVNMPMGGAGTWEYNDTVTAAEVEMAINMGVRLIDTANIYDNQAGVAKGIKAAGVPRSEIFISTKVPGGLGIDGTIAAHDDNLKLLQTDTVDLLLTHFPCGFPTSPTGGPVNCTKAARQATWKGLEAVYKAGKARAIGVSHYCQKHLEDILEIATVKISVNQEEWHLGMGPNPQNLVRFCSEHGISYQSFSALCGPCPKGSFEELTQNPTVTKIAKAKSISYNSTITGLQIALRWLVEAGSPVIPKSTNPVHLFEDLNIFYFNLNDEENEALSGVSKPPSAETVASDCQLSTADILV